MTFPSFHDSSLIDTTFLPPELLTATSLFCDNYKPFQSANYSAIHIHMKYLFTHAHAHTHQIKPFDSRTCIMIDDNHHFLSMINQDIQKAYY